MAGDMSADNEPPTAPQVLAPASTAEVAREGGSAEGDGAPGVLRDE